MSSVIREAVIPHYRTGEPILYVARASTARVVGLAQSESRALLDAVLRVLYDEAHILTHHWRTGDLVIWDNMALQHARPSLKSGVRRTLQRVMIATHPQKAQMPQDYVTPAKTYAPARA
jgi:taurine dioxygenase